MKASQSIVSTWNKRSTPLDGPKCERMVSPWSPVLGGWETAPRRSDGAFLLPGSVVAHAAHAEAGFQPFPKIA